MSKRKIRTSEFRIEELETCVPVYYPDENQHMSEYGTQYTGILIINGAHHELTDQQALHCAFLYWIRDSVPVEWEEFVDSIEEFHWEQVAEAKRRQAIMHDNPTGPDDLPF